MRKLFAAFGILAAVSVARAEINFVFPPANPSPQMQLRRVANHMAVVVAANHASGVSQVEFWDDTTNPPELHWVQQAAMIAEPGHYFGYIFGVVQGGSPKPMTVRAVVRYGNGTLEGKSVTFKTNTTGPTMLPDSPVFFYPVDHSPATQYRFIGETLPVHVLTSAVAGKTVSGVHIFDAGTGEVVCHHSGIADIPNVPPASGGSYLCLANTPVHNLPQDHTYEAYIIYTDFSYEYTTVTVKVNQ